MEVDIQAAWARDPSVDCLLCGVAIRSMNHPQIGWKNDYRMREFDEHITLPPLAHLYLLGYKLSVCFLRGAERCQNLTSCRLY
jgi:hypothetical protein